MNAKRIFKNYLYNTSYEVLILILPFLTAAYIARVLGADGIGKSDYTSSFAVVFAIFGKLGIDRYGSKHIAYKRDSKESRSEAFWNIWCLQVISTTISTLIYIIFFIVLGKSLKILFLFQLPIVLSTFLDISWFYIGLENFKKIVVRNTIIRSLCTISIFIFIKSYDDLNIYVLITSLTGFLGYFTYWFSLFKYINKLDISKVNIRPYIKESLVYFLPQVCIQLYTVADHIVVGYLTNLTELGYYSQSLKIPKISLAIINSLSTVLMPTMANMYKKKNIAIIELYLRRSLQITICIGIFAASSMAAVSRLFVPIYFGEKFNLIISYMMISSLIAIIVPIGLVFTNQFIIPTSKNREYIIPILLGTIVSFISNFILIPIVGGIGAVFTVILTELTITSLQITLVRKYLNIRKIFKGAYSYFLFGVVNFIVINYITLLFKANILTFLLCCALCFLCYGILMIKIKNPIRDKILKIYHEMKENTAKA
ncbi:oligosaccharide flippase family protein [uncultured Clostridium sp.]|uniref:oligosaccharide flippase family protein n=1 Tax=uncultured Clostridium sp. TaxID=59620 RepID=UPI002590C067|nr:oligosaccharide flippase family protein [uncultured Clostridium sp.]